MLRQLLATITALVLASSSWAAEPSFSDESRNEIQHLLEEIPAIRVHMVSAPGNGHQSANLRMIQRLRELGFKNRIQLIYQAGASEQLEYLLPGFSPKQKSSQNLNTKELGAIELIAEENAKSALEEKMKLTLSAALDGADKSYEFHRHKMNTDYYVQLQPRLWTENAAKRGIFVTGHDKMHPLQHLSNLGPLTVSARSETLDEQIARIKKVPEKGAALSELLKIKPKIDWMPAYSIDFTENPEGLMQKILQSLRKAAEQPKFDKPIIIPILTEFEKEEIQIFASAMEKINIAYHQLKEPELLSKIAQAKPGEIILVQVGRLPSEAFDMVISHATLPILLEGKNLTQAALERGLPFLNVTGSLVDIEAELKKKSADKMAKSHIRKAFASIDEIKPNGSSQKTEKDLASFFTEAKEGSVKDFFQTLRTDPNSLEKDLIARSLLELKEVMQSTKPKLVKSKPSPPCALNFKRLSSKRLPPGKMKRMRFGR